MKKLIKINKSRKKYSKNNKNSKRTKSKLNNKNKNNKKVASKLYGGASASLDTKPSFKMLSWNIFFQLFKHEYPTKTKVKIYIDKYLIEKKPDILFVQETPYKLLLDNYTCISSSYINPGLNDPAGISINFNNDVFEIVDANKIVRGTFSEKNFVIGDIIIDNEQIYENIIPDAETPINRPILAVKLKHIHSKKHIIFVNLWAAHHIVDKDKERNFVEYLSKIIIDCGYVEGEHIIIAGDFNEYSSQTFLKNELSKNPQFNKSKYNTLYKQTFKSQDVIDEITELKFQIGTNVIILKSKQNKVSCCGNITGGISDNKIALPTYWKTKLNELNFDDEKNPPHLIDDENMMGYWKTDLLFTDLNAKVNVDYTQKISDHFPVIAEIEL